MTIKPIRILTGVLLSLLVFTALEAGAAKAEMLDRIVAVVNNQIITEKELEARMDLVKEQARAEKQSLPDESRLRQQVLDQMVTQSLQLQVAKSNNLTVTQNQLNEQISQIAQKNGMDLAQFKQALQQQGINYAQYRKRLHEQMTVQMMQQRAIAPKIQITDQQVQNFLQTYKNSPHSDSQFHVADIVVPLPDNPTPQAVAKAKKQADKITSRLKQGADFHQTAIARSSGVNALEGGDLGWNRLGELPDVFTHYLLKMQPGEVSGPIKAPNGYHVIKLVAVKHADTKLTKKNARQMLFRREFNRRLQAWLQELRGQAYIKTMLNGDGKDGQ